MTIDAVKTASVQPALRDESEEVVAEQDIGVGDEQPVAVSAPERDVFGVELHSCEKRKGRRGRVKEPGGRGRGGESRDERQQLRGP